MLTKLAALVALLCSVGCVAAHPPPPVQAQARAPRDRHVYRVDFVVAANDPGKAPQTSAYTLNLEEYDDGEVHMGTNIALSSQARMDVGLKIKASLSPSGNDLVLHDSVEMSGVEETTAPQTSIHKVSTHGEAVLRAGQPALVASLEDPLSHRRYQVTAAATLLR
jgi:hypothetical protein